MRFVMAALSPAMVNKLVSSGEFCMPFDETGRRPGRRPARNVLGGPIGVCSNDPMTGFFRNGCCETSPEDLGSHTVCVVMTAKFLAFSKAQGNDLSTPR